MIRRDLIIQDLRYSHRTTPRKQRTYAHSTAYQSSTLYRSLRGHSTPMIETKLSDRGDGIKKWIGKLFIPSHESENPEIINIKARSREFVTENEIAQFARPNYYRIFRVRDEKVVSKPKILNGYELSIFLDENDKILDVRYL